MDSEQYLMELSSWDQPLGKRMRLAERQWKAPIRRAFDRIANIVDTEMQR